MQTVFERFGKVVTLSVPEDFTAAGPHDPRIQYLIDYGWKQSLSDSYAAAKNGEEFEGKLKARYDAILAGTVRSPGTGTAKGPRLSPVEREMLRIATDFIDAILVKRPQKVAKEDRKVYIDLYLEKNKVEIEEKAKAHIEATAKSAAESGDILDQLLASVAEEETVAEESETKRKKGK